MANTSAVYARIDTQLKENAEAILAQLGITPIARLFSIMVFHSPRVFLPKRQPPSAG